MSDFLNDGSGAAPRLKCFLNQGNLVHLPEGGSWPSGLQGASALERLRADGFEGLQGGDPAACRESGMECAASGRVDRPGDARERVREFQEAGYQCATLHAGSGFEEDAEMDALVAEVIETAADTGFPLFIETHRATLTQDIWRTLQLVQRQPGIRFNGDFSHYYTGHEMTYGDISAKFDRMEPIFERVRFLHGRIGNSCCMQVDIGDGTEPAPQEFGLNPFVVHFRDMWTRVMRHFRRNAGPGDYLVFAPEILYPRIYYARMFPGPDGSLREESDRYEQALVYCRIARECWEAAEAS